MTELASEAGRVASVPRREWGIGTIMVAIGVVAPLCTLARLNPYFGAMTTAYVALFGALAYQGQRAGSLAIPLATAIGTTLALIVGWCVIRPLAHRVVLQIFDPAGWAEIDIYRWTMINYRFRHIPKFAPWEAWSLLRWWLLFGAIAWAGGPRADRPRRARALLGFAWAFALLDVGILFGTWPALGNLSIVPEHSSLFTTWWMSNGAVGRYGYRFWAVRVAAPTLLVGPMFFRSVMGAARWKAGVGAVLLLPAVVVVSIAWSLGYYQFFKWGLI